MAFDVEAYRAQAYQGKRVVVMGYGLYAHGSGIAATRYLAEAGAEIIVSDLRSQEVLQENVARLAHYPNIIWKLGMPHAMQDFIDADIVIKNPGVHKSSPFLAQAKRIESDISLFLYEYQAMQATHQHQMIAVTGSKGKSSTVSLLYHLLSEEPHACFLAGNITVSPLFHLQALWDKPHSRIILELSSWQLGDLAGKDLLKPTIALLTNLMADHLNYYQWDMRAYAEDKAEIFAHQGQDALAILPLNDLHMPYFLLKIKARVAFFSENALPSIYADGIYWRDERTLVIREHFEERVFPLTVSSVAMVRVNLANAIWIAHLMGVAFHDIQARLASYTGLIYRYQVIAEDRDHCYINDSAATIPEATIEAIKFHRTTSKQLALILGGADKGSNVVILLPWLKEVAYVYLLQGTASASLEAILHTSGVAFSHNWSDLSAIVHDFRTRFADQSVDLLLSPAVASFGLFSNEFERGRAFDEAIKGLR